MQIPRIITSISSAKTTKSPEEYFQRYKNAAESASRDLGTFRTEWTAPATREIIERAKTRRKENSDLSSMNRVRKYGWVKAKARLDHKAKKAQNADVKEEAAGDIDVGGILENFRKQNPQLHVELDDTKENIKVCLPGNWSIQELLMFERKIQFKALAIPYTFVITRKLNNRGRWDLDVVCLGESRVHEAITRCIRSRPRPKDFEYLLVWINAQIYGLR
jgi:hypothetical protein